MELSQETLNKITQIHKTLLTDGNRQMSRKMGNAEIDGISIGDTVDVDRKPMLYTVEVTGFALVWDEDDIHIEVEWRHRYGQTGATPTVNVFPHEKLESWQVA